MGLRKDRARENHLYELALEFVYKRPYEDLLVEVRASKAKERDLLELGRRIYLDLIRLGRGEISTIAVPSRMPQPGEHKLPV